MAALPGLAAVLLGIATLYIVLYRLQLRRRRPDEPPVVVAPGLPFVGHVLCMALMGGRYLQQLGLRLQQHDGQEHDGSTNASSLTTPTTTSTASSPPAGIVTLPVPGSRIYLVTEPSLAAAVQRASRAMSFTPLVPDVTRRVLGLDDVTVKIVRGDNLAVASSPKPVLSGTGAHAMSIVDENRYDESYGFLADMHHMVYSYLGPGEKLNEFVHIAAHELVAQVNDYASAMAKGTTASLSPSSTPVVVDLLAWMKHFVTIGTAQFLYGKRNPLAVQPDLEPAFWEFVHGLGRLLLVGDRRPGSLAASLLGGRPYAAREALVAGFESYLADDENLRESASEGGAGTTKEATRATRATRASDIVRRRVAIADQYGWTRANTAREELSFLFAGIINTAVTSFWVVLRLFADPAMLATVRKELEGQSAEKERNRGLPSEGGDSLSPSFVLSINHVKNHCPMLMAVYQECLRLGSNNMSTRLVLADTMLADRYFLRAGSVVQISAGVIHADPRVWGSDAEVFDPSRFLPKGRADKAEAGGNERSSEERRREPGGNEASEKGREASREAKRTREAKETKRHPAAFRAFGGGKTLCPGRHFATAEILTFVAAVVLLFDAEDASVIAKGVPLRVPPRNDRVLPIHILEPAPKDVPQARLRLRQAGRRIEVVP